MSDTHHESCEICGEELSEDDAEYAGEVLRVHEECRPLNNIDTSDHPGFPPFEGGLK